MLNFSTAEAAHLNPACLLSTNEAAPPCQPLVGRKGAAGCCHQCCGVSLLETIVGPVESPRPRYLSWFLVLSSLSWAALDPLQAFAFL